MDKRLSKAVCITNRKGGTGKTMTVVSLAAALARQGMKVLVVDSDSQHSLTVSLGVGEPDKLRVTLATVMSDIIDDKEVAVDIENPQSGIIQHEEGIHLMPANNSLAGVEIALAPLIGRETVLKQYIDMIKPMYDYVLIDTPPTLDLLTVNALAAADSVIIPVAPKFLDAKGLELLLKSIAKIRRHINPELSIEGILLTLVDIRARFTRDIVAMIERAYGGQIRIFKDSIPHSVRAVEASATGKSIFTHDPNGKVALAYAKAAQELLSLRELSDTQELSPSEVELSQKEVGKSA